MKCTKIFAAILVIAMMFSVVGCGNNNVVENNDVENVGTNDVVNTNPKQEEIVDDYYVPNTENLVGIAVYPVDDRNNYPYACDEKVTNFSDWKFIYQIDENTFAYDDNIVSRSLGYGTFISTKEFYWGYVYVDGVGNYYIIATHDYCDRGNDANDYRMICNETMMLDVHVVENIPDAYVFEYSWFNYLTTEIRDSVEYKADSVPTSIVLPDEKTHNCFNVSYMFNGQKVDFDTDLDSDMSYEKVKNAGTISWAFNGFKNGESYQYYIDIVYPDFQ